MNKNNDTKLANQIESNNNSKNGTHNNSSSTSTNTASKSEALQYHANFPEGKWGMHCTKPMSAKAMSLAYSPGVAEPCVEIHKNPEDAKLYTAKQNTVAVISNGTAVLGLGNIGALASKPVMEGKSILMNYMAGLYATDLLVDDNDPNSIIDLVKRVTSTYGAINLEDIKAPECFQIEEELQNAGIPVFHDDQHGTAIVATAGIDNALHLTSKSWDSVVVVMNGAGAAGIACLDSMVSMGLKPENIMLFDSKGLINQQRTDLNKYKQKYATAKASCSLEEALNGADVFVGVSKAGALKPEWLKDMNRDPIIFGLANPEPEIMPNVAKEARSDCIMATGRSDFPNQINNILCFPYIFRGALDSHAKCINTEMKRACIKAIASLARNDSRFSKDYIVPHAIDERLALIVSHAVAKAAFDSKVGNDIAINGSDNSSYGRIIERRLNAGSENYFSLSNSAKIDFSAVDYSSIETFFKYWDVNISHDENSKLKLVPFEKSCNNEKLIWIFDLGGNPFVAYSAHDNNHVENILTALSKSNFSNLPHIPIYDLQQCKALEKRNDLCGRISISGDKISMECKPGLKNSAYLALILSGVQHALSTN